MMDTIVKEGQISFKELEQKIFAYACGLAREITVQMLESYDKELAEGRDRGKYRCKGKRQTSIKTVYGEVEYQRNVYRTETEEGQTAHVFLLDEAMQMDKIGLISTNLAEKIAMTVTESPLPCNSRNHQQHLRPEYQCWRCLEHDAAFRREDQ